MRTPAALLLGAALGALAPHASAQQASPAAAQAPAPPTEPPYDPTAHGGLSYGAYLRATRGRGLESPGMMAVGIVLVGVGNIVMGVGTAMYAAAADCSGSLPPSLGGAGCSPSAGHTSAMAFLMAGTVMTAIGIPLWVLGETPVPRVEAAGLGQGVPSLRVGPGGAALSWSF